MFKSECETCKTMKNTCNFRCQKVIKKPIERIWGFNPKIMPEWVRYENNNRRAVFPKRPEPSSPCASQKVFGAVGDRPLVNNLCYYELVLKGGEQRFKTLFGVAGSDHHETFVPPDSQQDIYLFRPQRKTSELTEQTPLVYGLLFNRKLGSLTYLENNKIIHVHKKNFANYQKNIYLCVVAVETEVTINCVLTDMPEPAWNTMLMQTIKLYKRSDVITKDKITAEMSANYAKLVKWLAKNSISYSHPTHCPARQVSE